jgi:hypothetical protein
VNGRDIDDKVLILYRYCSISERSWCKSAQGKREEFKAGTGWFNTYIRSYVHACRHTHTYVLVHTYIGKGKVHHRTVHEGPEEGKCIALLFL